MKSVVAVASAVAVIVVLLGFLAWLRIPEPKSVVGGTTFSSFNAPDYLDAAGFAERLVAAGFVAVPEADFKSLLPPQFHAAGTAPGEPAPDFTAMPAYRHRANSASHTRLVGYDARTHRVHYYHGLALERQGSDGPLVGDERDTVEETLRK